MKDTFYCKYLKNCSTGYNYIVLCIFYLLTCKCSKCRVQHPLKLNKLYKYLLYIYYLDEYDYKIKYLKNIY